MFVFSWEDHLSEGQPLLWLFTDERDENKNVAIVRQTNGTFEFYEGEDGELFPTAALTQVNEDQTGTGHTFELYLGYQVLAELVTLRQFGYDMFLDPWGRSWVITDPADYDFERTEQDDQPVILMTPYS